ncbi:endonuclease/exonuclease/phosphatase family protein [Streptomyces violascens]|uniref:endonuclease/exonuclease/phosphatase family protein n=1 Tax=Streptomyces violascens TaxID=67381 RepID=UPI00167ACDE8|nr:endonuclease/exonuclease/phosphatase family protein [Streptomyces violascens]GGU47127.1 teicoplanin resistance protein VanJ [Streptomyces violascens]
MTQTDTAVAGGGSAEGERFGVRLRRLIDGRRGDRGIWRRGPVLAGLALLLAVALFFHAEIPNAVGNLGSLTETFLPWLGILVPVLLVLALWRRSATALIAVLVPAVMWLNLFGGLLGDKQSSGGNLVVVTHNVKADNPDPAGTARKLAASGADILALEELDTTVYERVLKDSYPYHAIEGTVGLWSKYPMSDTRPVDIKIGWTRALRSTVRTPAGPVAVYVAHMPSVRVKPEAGFTVKQRDNSANALGDLIAGDSLPKRILLGDLNGTMNDRSLNNITSQMRSAQGAAGDGFGFSWPASFPMARIDQIMVKGIEPKSAWTLPETGSDHLPVAARLQV